jgi:hypothetical protein
VSTLVQAALFAALAFHAFLHAPAIIGDLGRQLPDKVLAEVERVAWANGDKPWLLNGEARQIDCVEAYYPPRSSNGVVRRGSMVTIWHRPVVSADPKGPWVWALFQKDDYAQVGLPGRDFEHFTGDQDPNRPFRVVGRFSDDEIASLATFARSSPVWAPESGGHAAIEGTWPLLRIYRQADGQVYVDLRHTELSGQGVQLRQQGTAWVILAIYMWIV